MNFFNFFIKFVDIVSIFVLRIRNKRASGLSTLSLRLWKRHCSWYVVCWWNENLWNFPQWLSDFHYRLTSLEIGRPIVVSLAQRDVWSRNYFHWVLIDWCDVRCTDASDRQAMTLFLVCLPLPHIVVFIFTPAQLNSTDVRW